MDEKVRRLLGQVSRVAAKAAEFLGEMGLFGALYFSQRMAEGFVAVVLLIHLFPTNSAIGKAATFSFAIAVPAALKWVWEPLVAKRGTRLGWILGSTLVMALTLFFLPEAEVWGFVAVTSVAVLNSMALATQDLVTDGVALAFFPVQNSQRWKVQFMMKLGTLGGMGVGASAALYWSREDVFPWAMICRLLAVFVLVSGVMIFVWWRRLGISESQASGTERQGAGWRLVFSTLKIRNVWALVLAGLFAKAASSMTAPLIPRWYRMLEFGGGWEAMVTTTDTVLKMVGALVAGLLASRVGERRVLAVCAVLFGASYASLGVFSSHWGDSTVVFAQICVGSFGEGAMLMVFLLLAMKVASSTQSRVAVFALVTGAANASELWSKWACKELWLAKVAGIGDIFLLAGAAQLLVLVGIMLMTEEKGDDPTQK